MPHPGFTAFDVAYFRLARSVAQNGELKPTRQGGAVRSLHAAQIRVPLSAEGAPALPYLHSKLIPLRSVMAELRWFLRGGTNARELQREGSSIWLDDAAKHASRVVARGDAAPEDGDLGPIYGRQWLKSTLDAGGPFTQVERAAHLLAEDPFSRRIVVDSWSPGELHQMAVPPCHYAFQFTCAPADANTLKVNCCVTMRSTDVGLGLPFNVVSYAMLTHLMCAEASRLNGKLEFVAGELVVNMADCHIYLAHHDALLQALIPVGDWIATGGERAAAPTVTLNAAALTFANFLGKDARAFCDEAVCRPAEWDGWTPPRVRLPLLT